jgi:CheY-like chemotaxis protein
MDGYEATQKIRYMSRLWSKSRRPVIIALTASVFEDQKARILEAGCDDFAQKPFYEEVIFDMMARHLGVRYLYESGRDKPLPPADAHPNGAEKISTIPVKWRFDLEQAVNRLDMEAIAALVDEIRETHPVAAETMIRLVDNFQFEDILTLIKEQTGE